MIVRWRRRAGWGAVALLLLTAGSACGGSRPFYDAGEPPFISPKGFSLHRRAAALGGRTPAHRLILIGDAGAPAAGRRHAHRPRAAGAPTCPTAPPSPSWATTCTRAASARTTSAAKVYCSSSSARRRRGRSSCPATTTGATGRSMPRGSRTRSASSTPSRRARPKLLPKGGCPGPALETLVVPGDGLVRAVQLLAIDLDWWLLDADERPACDGIGSEADFARALERTLRAHAESHVVVVAHHPLRTGGPHGGRGRGFFVGQLVRMAGGLGIEVHDLDASAYRAMLKKLRPALAAEPPAGLRGRPRPQPPGDRGPRHGRHPGRERRGLGEERHDGDGHLRHAVRARARRASSCSTSTATPTSATRSPATA